METHELREIFAEELGRVGEVSLAAQVRDGTDNSRCGEAALAAMQRAVRRTEIGRFVPVVSIGTDKNGEIDFRINMIIAQYDREKMNELCRMIPWTVKEALTLWLDHGPPSKDMAAQKSAVAND